MTVARQITPHSAVVFFAEVDETTPINWLKEFLSSEECERADRIVSNSKMREFIAAHALLRFCFRATTGRLDWPIRCNAFGKPEIFIPASSSPLHISLTHTHGLVACALSARDAIGVDAEALNCNVDATSIANSFFARTECDMLASLPEDKIIPTFFTLWTYKEAIVKAMGRGLSVPFRDFAVSCNPPSVIFEDHLEQDPDRWALDSLLLREHQLAVAIIRESHMISPKDLKWQRVDFAEFNQYGSELYCRE